jgi:hypothetical protein
MQPTAKETCRLALEDAAALIERLRADVESRRDEMDSAAINWTDAATAQQLASDLLYIVARPHYRANASEEPIRERVLAEARANLARREGRPVADQLA